MASGPSHGNRRHENLLVLQAFLAVCNSMALVLAADVAERRDAEESLVHTRESSNRASWTAPRRFFR